jgi:two-component sensor histidine kinase
MRPDGPPGSAPDDRDSSGARPPAAPARRSIRARIVLYLVLAIAPAVGLAVADGLRKYGAAVDEAEQRFLSTAIVDAQRERDAFLTARATLATLALSPALAELGAAECDAALSAVEASSPRFLLLIALDARGVVRCASRASAKGRDLGAMEAFRRFAADPKFEIAVTDRGAITGRKVVLARAPLRDGDAFRGAIILSMPVDILRFLDRAFDEDGGFGDAPPSVVRGIVDATGRLVLTQRDADEGGAWLPQAAALRPLLTAGSGVATADGRDGVERVFAVSPLIDAEAWLVAADTPAHVYDGLLARAAPSILAPMVTLIIALGVAYVAMQRLVVRHIVHLARITRAYGSGRLDLRPNIADSAPEEIATLAEALETMAGRLRDRQASLAQSAETNRVLLMELYHRVKNNLQMIASLLSLQARRAQSDVERAALDRARARVYSLSLVHETLYAPGDRSAVALDALVREIAAHIAELGRDPAAPRPALELDLAPLAETPDRATPLALFLNEAMTNAVKHAEGGPIRVSLEPAGAGGYRLSVENAVGAACPEGAGETLGVRLMDGFARQLRAEAVRDVRDGVFRVALTVPARASAS